MKKSGSAARVPTIQDLEVQLQSSPNNLPVICQLVKLYYQQNKIPPSANTYSRKAFDIFVNNHEVLSAEHGWSVANIFLLQFKHLKYNTRGSMKLNTSPERLKLLDDLQVVLNALVAKNDSTYSQRVLLLLACVKEWKGNYTEALSILSDLISQQAMEEVDLSYIILKAAVLLKHIGQTKQALEYFEFLLDDPPTSQGFTKVHIHSYLVLLYETSGDKYKVFLNVAYKDLALACKEAASGPGVSRQSKKLLEIATNVNVSKSSELWELMTIHALDKCEYVLSAEIMSLATRLAPSKGTLWLRYAEVLFLSQEKAQAEKVGEQALEVLQDNGDVHNLLIQINPEKWTERLRYSSPTRGQTGDQIAPPVSAPISSSKPTQRSWLGKIKSTAVSAIQAVVAPTTAGESASRPTSRGPSPIKAKPLPDDSSMSSQPNKSEPNNLSPPISPNVKEGSSSPPPSSTSPVQTTLPTNTTSSVVPTTSYTAATITKEDKTASTNVNKSKKSPPRERSKPSTTTQSLRPTRPANLNPESKKYIDLALKGNNNVYYYHPTLSVLSQIPSNPSDKEN